MSLLFECVLLVIVIIFLFILPMHKAWLNRVYHKRNPGTLVFALLIRLRHRNVAPKVKSIWERSFTSACNVRTVLQSKNFEHDSGESTAFIAMSIIQAIFFVKKSAWKDAFVILSIFQDGSCILLVYLLYDRKLPRRCFFILTRVHEASYLTNCCLCVRKTVTFLAPVLYRLLRIL